MKLVANIQLKPTLEQEASLRATLERCNEACNWLSETGFAAGITRQYALHKLGYYETRKRFGLAAQATVRCIAKVADAYKGRRVEVAQSFRKHAAQPYDHNIFRFTKDDTVSIWTISGRFRIPFVCGERQRKLLAFRKGEVDLMLVGGRWYVACVCDIPDPAEIDVEGILGVDFGIVNIAYDSQGRSYSGATIDRARDKFSKRRAALQRRNTKAAKRRLKKLSGKEARFRRHINHCISKEIVASAKRSRFAIAIEDLTHIRKRVKARKAQRNRLHGWSFAQLRQFVTYKAKLAGIPAILVNPRNTSRACPRCGLIDKKNRHTQAIFSCRRCRHTAPADFIAAENISSSAAGVACKPALSSRSGSPRAGKKPSASP